MLKITLINPPLGTRYPQPPVGLALLAAILEKARYTVGLIDANALGLSLAETVDQASTADVVGLTAMTPSIGIAVNIARMIRQKSPRTKIIFGGAHATLLPGETLEASPETDIVVKGEGEETIIEVLQALENNRPLDNISGISYRRDTGIIHNPARNAMVDMDSLPFPAHHLLPWQKYRPHPPHGRAMPFGAIVTSRGCPYHCGYCSKPVFGSRFRAQSPERVVAEMIHLKEKYGIKEIAFYDDSFTLDKKRADAIAGEIIARKLKVDWTCETRVNLVDKGLLRHMKESGCYAIAYGIESASAEIIETLQKDITPEQVTTAVRDTRAAGIQVVGYFMIGSPGETPETIQQTIDLAKQLKVDFAQFSVTTPFPGTDLYEIYMRGRKESPDWESFIYAGTDNPTTPVFESDNLSRTDLQTWLKRAYRGFYLRPAYIWQRLSWCTSWSEIRMNLRGFGMLMRSV